MSGQGHRIPLLIPSPLAVLTAGGTRSAHGLFDWPEGTTRTQEPETHASQAVAADPQILDTETDRDYGHGMVSHDTAEDTFGRGGASFRDSGEGVPTGSHRDAPGKAAHHFDRAAFLARVQRIDPRERKP